ETQHGADVDYSTAALLPHVGRDSARHADDSEEVRVEDRARLFDGALLRSRRGSTETGVVNQQVDSALPPNHFSDYGIDRCIAGHIERQHLERALARFGCPSTGAVHRVPGRREL